MYVISKTFRFAAAHHLPQLPEGHKCRRHHGHNYEVTVILASMELKKTSFVRDYGELDVIKKWLDEMVDHRDLNEVVSFYTTAENLAAYFYDEFRRLGIPEIVAVKVCETDNTTALYIDNNYIEKIISDAGAI